MRITRLAAIACACSLVSCAGYIRRHQPVAIVRHGNTCDMVYEVKTRRAGLDIIHGGLISVPGRKEKSYKVTLANHGAPFGITLHSWRSSDRGWLTIPAGATREVLLTNGDLGFQTTAYIDGVTTVPRGAHIRATITYQNIPTNLERTYLIESAGNL